MCLAVPGLVLAIDAGDGASARVDFGGVVRAVRLDLVPDARAGDHVLVHAGYAIQTLSAEDAAETNELLRELSTIGGAR